MAQTEVNIRMDSQLENEADTDPFYSESNMKVLSESIKAAEEGRLTAHELVLP